MKKIIKSVSRDIVCIANMCYVRTYVWPTFYVNYAFNLNDA